MNTSTYICEPIAVMRESPTPTSKVVSQAICSEKIDVQEERGGWSCITTPDGYTGWIQSSDYVTLAEPFTPTIKTSRLSAHLYIDKDIEYGPLKTLPYGVQLRVLDASDSRWIEIVLPGKKGFIQRGDVMPEETLQHASELSSFSQKFLGIPYTWGGRSSFGYDCSGFVQMLYNKIGIQLQRDARQQILDSRFKTIDVESCEPGDLIFFGKSEKRIMHVGMAIGQTYFIHASARENQPWIRISSFLDEEWSSRSEVHYPFRSARRWYS